jgi:hypothetical protein
MHLQSKFSSNSRILWRELVCLLLNFLKREYEGNVSYISDIGTHFTVLDGRKNMSDILVKMYLAGVCMFHVSLNPTQRRGRSIPFHAFFARRT